jgi:hypothetical protein
MTTILLVLRFDSLLYLVTHTESMKTFHSSFQRAAEVVDPLGIPTTRRRGDGGGGKFLQDFA